MRLLLLCSLLLAFVAVPPTASAHNHCVIERSWVECQADFCLVKLVPYGPHVQCFGQDYVNCDADVGYVECFGSLHCRVDALHAGSLARADCLGGRWIECAGDAQQGACDFLFYDVERCEWMGATIACSGRTPCAISSAEGSTIGHFSCAGTAWFNCSTRPRCQFVDSTVDCTSGANALECRDRCSLNYGGERVALLTCHGARIVECHWDLEQNCGAESDKIKAILEEKV